MSKFRLFGFAANSRYGTIPCYLWLPEGDASILKPKPDDKVIKSRWFGNCGSGPYFKGVARYVWGDPNSWASTSTGLGYNTLIMGGYYGYLNYGTYYDGETYWAVNPASDVRQFSWRWQTTGYYYSLREMRYIPLSQRSDGTWNVLQISANVAGINYGVFKCTSKSQNIANLSRILPGIGINLEDFYGRTGNWYEYRNYGGKQLAVQMSAIVRQTTKTSSTPLVDTTKQFNYWRCPDENILQQEYTNWTYLCETNAYPGAWKNVSALAVVNAVESLPRITSNTLANLKDFASAACGVIPAWRGAVTNFSKFVSRCLQQNLDPRNEWLTYRYVYSTTKMDLEEMRDVTSRCKDLYALWVNSGLETFKQYGYAVEGEYRSRYKTEFYTSEVIHTDVSYLESVVSLKEYYEQYYSRHGGVEDRNLKNDFRAFKYYARDQVRGITSYIKANELRDVLEDTNTKLSAYNTWDMIPFSFMVDWFAHIGDALSHAESWNTALALRRADSWISITRVRETSVCYARAYGTYPALPPTYVRNKAPSGRTIGFRIADTVSIFT